MTDTSSEYHAVIINISTKSISAGFVGEAEPATVLQLGPFKESCERALPPYFELDHSLTALERKNIIEGLTSDPILKDLSDIFTTEQFLWFPLRSLLKCHSSATLSREVRAKVVDLLVNRLLVTPSRTKIFLIDSFITESSKNIIYNELLYGVGVRSIYCIPEPILTIVGAQSKHGLVVDIGWLPSQSHNLYTMKTPGILDIIKLLFNPNVSKMMILQIAYGQLKIIGLAKILSAVLGLLIVGVSSVIKVPQIKKIVKPELLLNRIQVAQGLSLEGISLETLSNWIHVAYNSQNNNPFRNYGESLFVGVQNIAIILLIDYYNARSRLGAAGPGEDDIKIRQALQELVRPAAVIAGSIVFLTKLAPERLISTLQIASIPISIVSKLPQIRQNHRLQRASHLSEITVGANLIGSLIRVFTTVQDFDKLGRDKVLLAGYGLSLVLNLVLAGQVWYYGKQEQQEKQEKKD